jgi:hypothetical protein
VLEQRGWKIYRIWSTDWFRSRAVEIDRLRQYLASVWEKTHGFADFGHSPLHFSLFSAVFELPDFCNRWISA